MAQLRQGYDRFVERDAEIVVVGPEGRGAFAAYWRAAKLPFVGLPDPEHEVLDLYGQEVKVSWVARLREVRSFSGAAALRDQLERDQEAALAALAVPPRRPTS